MTTRKCFDYIIVILSITTPSVALWASAVAMAKFWHDTPDIVKICECIAIGIAISIGITIIGLDGVGDDYGEGI